MTSANFYWLMILSLAVALGAAPAVAQNEPTAVGLWEQVSENGKPESWFRIYERNGRYEGKIVKIFPPPGRDPNPICEKCEGAEKNAPVLNLTLLKGMERNGLSYENGTILDPRDGTVYRALMKVSPDGKKLEVRGYVGISLFGRSQTWNRLPDNAMDPPGSASRPRGGGTPAQKK